MSKSIQQPLPPMLLSNETQAESMRPEGTQEADTLASVLFDAALTASQITTADVAYRLGNSESLVRRMRNRDARENVSYVQLLKLPPSFHLARFRLENAHFGLGRAALLDLLDAAGRVALMVEP